MGRYTIDNTGDGQGVNNQSDPTAAGVIAYSMPVIGSVFCYIPMFTILPGIYAKHFGIELTAIATVMFLIRLFDGISDPTIGYLADRHRSRGGSRKLWVAAGAIGLVVASAFLFMPPKPITVHYYLAWSMLFFLSYTVFEIPHLTWGSELTRGYNARARIYGIRAVASKIGILGFYAMPLLPIYTSNEYTPELLEDAVYIGVAVMIVGLGWSLWRAPPGYIFPSKGAESLAVVARSIVMNKPLMIYFYGFVFVGLSYGMWFGLLYLYLDQYLLMGNKVALVFTLATFISMFSAYLWTKVIELTSKSITWAMGMFMYCMGVLGLLYVSADTSWWIVLLLITMAFIAFACHNVAALSILADIADYGKLKFHKDRGATYFAINNLLYKVGLAFGGSIALAVAGGMGFDPALTIQSAQAVEGLKIGFIILPLLSMLIAIILILKTPINQRRHCIIVKRLAMNR